MPTPADLDELARTRDRLRDQHLRTDMLCQRGDDLRPEGSAGPQIEAVRQAPAAILDDDAVAQPHAFAVASTSALATMYTSPFTSSAE